MEHCRRGESEQALSMFAAIREQLAPPPAILRLIQDLEATRCDRTVLAGGAALRVQVGGGWDSNVSQGITARSLVLGSGDNVLELELDQSYRPRASAFVQASADYSLVLPGPGINLQMALGHRKNARESTFDVTSVSASASRDFKLGAGTLRGQMELSEVWLGGKHYQRNQSVAAQWLNAESRGSWLASVSATSARYLTQPSQDSLQLEAGLLREQRLNAALSGYAGASLLRDEARGARPGGDRQGFELQFGSLVIAYGWRFRPQLTYTRWTSADVFAAGLLDVQRRNRLAQATLQAEKPLSSRTSLVLEWRGRWADDTVALYRYQAKVLSATLAHRF